MNPVRGNDPIHPKYSVVVPLLDEAGSIRELHRRLSEEGTSFSAIVDALRTQAVNHHIEDRDRTLSDIAEILGFSDVSALSRWFKRRFGRSVSEWRAGK